MLNLKIVLPALLIGFPICSYSAPLSLECAEISLPLQEQKRIQELAKDVVTRKSKYELRVSVNGKTLKFIDKAPYDEQLSGVHYQFCDRKEGFILLHVADEGLFSGQLINEATGRIIRGGQEVHFSDDRRAYFTIEQPDGLDGAVWNIYAVDGTQSWSGFSFIPQKGHPEIISAVLNDPKWATNGVFIANAQCAALPAVKWNVKLVKISGKWDWSPQQKCQ